MLTIITITYRDPSGLAATLASLRPLLSWNGDWQHVVVDSSPEENAALLVGLDPVWPLVHLTPPPRGIYAAMNAGLEVASGDLVWFLNGGDRLAEPSVLREVLDHFAADPTLDVLMNGAWPLQQGVRLEKGRLPGGFRKRVDADLRNALVGGNGVPHQGVIYRRGVFERFGAFDATYRMMADYEHLWRGVLGGMQGRCTELILAEFDADGLSATDYRLWRREMRRVNASLARRLPPALYAEHRRLDRWWTVVRAVRKVGVAFPRVRAVLRPLWRRVAPDPLPATAAGRERDERRRQ